MSAFLIWDNANDYRMTALRRVQNGRDVSGKIVVITGATGALGREACLALYVGGAHVIATGRNLQKTETVCKALMERELPPGESVVRQGGTIEAMQLDMGDYDSIRAFVKTLQTKYPKIDILINNAGVIPTDEFTTSKYGVEITYQTNFASAVVLTELLLPLLADNARIVNIGSMSHAHGPNPNNWDTVPSTEESFGGYDKDYCESKWLITAYTEHLHQRKICAVVADPGVSPDSAMWDNVAPIKRFLVKNVFKFLTKSSAQAAACGVQAIVAPEVESGGYYCSGVLSPNEMRPDCKDAQEWNKAAAILKGLLPADLQELVHETPE